MPEDLNKRTTPLDSGSHTAPAAATSLGLPFESQDVPTIESLLQRLGRAEQLVEALTTDIAAPQSAPDLLDQLAGWNPPPAAANATEEIDALLDTLTEQAAPSPALEPQTPQFDAATAAILTETGGDADDLLNQILSGDREAEWGTETSSVPVNAAPVNAAPVKTPEAQAAPAPVLSPSVTQFEALPSLPAQADIAVARVPEPTPVAQPIVAAAPKPTSERRDSAAGTGAAAQPVAAAPVQAESNPVAAALEAIDSELTLLDPMDSPAGQQAEATLQQVVFYLSGTSYSVPITEVLEMSTVPATTALPNVPHFVRGVTNLRGEVLAVIDLRLFLGMEAAGDPLRERMLVVRPPGSDSVAGLIVEGVRGLARTRSQQLRQPAGPVSDPVVPYLAGVTEYEDQVLHALDLGKLFLAPEIVSLSIQ